MRKKISTTVYITPEQNESLRILSRRTRVPVAEYIREAIDLLLIKYSSHIPGYQPALPLDINADAPASLSGHAISEDA